MPERERPAAYAVPRPFAWLEDLVAALANVETAARELDALFEGDPDGWRLGGRMILNEDVSTALLSLHDYLSDVTIARQALPAPDASVVTDEMIERAALQLAGAPRCYCPDDWREDSPERVKHCPAHGSAAWPLELHRRIVEPVLAAALEAPDAG